MTSTAPWLYLLTDRRRLCDAVGVSLDRGCDLLVSQAEGAAEGGVTAFQIRERDLTTAALVDLTRDVRAALGTACRLVVNDRADVAVATGAGVHLREDSIPAARVRAWLPHRTWISAARHAPIEPSGDDGADLFVAGTVQASRSKPTGSAPLGFAGLAAVVASTTVPVVGVGGLGARDWAAVNAAGAVGIAAIDFFLPQHGETPATAVRRAVREWQQALQLLSPRGTA